MSKKTVDNQILDLCTRCIVGWSVSYNMKKELVLNTLIKACLIKNPSKGLIVHSDQGSHFGSCWDNACIESFFRLLKVEELNDYNFIDIEEVKYVIFCYIEYFYNRKRIHTQLGYKTPSEFEDKIRA